MKWKKKGRYLIASLFLFYICSSFFIFEVNALPMKEDVEIIIADKTTFVTEDASLIQYESDTDYLFSGLDNNSYTFSLFYFNISNVDKNWTNIELKLTNLKKFNESDTNLQYLWRGPDYWNSSLYNLSFFKDENNPYWEDANQNDHIERVSIINSTTITANATQFIENGKNSYFSLVIGDNVSLGGGNLTVYKWYPQNETSINHSGTRMDLIKVPYLIIHYPDLLNWEYIVVICVINIVVFGIVIYIMFNRKMT